MGSHTDYNLGHVLAATVDRDVLVAARRREDGVLNLFSLNTGVEVRVPLSGLRFEPGQGWANYPLGVIKELMELGAAVRGLDLVFHGEVPVGGNLSSSAALEAATCEAVLGLVDFSLAPWERIVLAKRAENVFMGLPCGVMDQFTVFMGRENSAVLLNCRDLQYRLVPFASERTVLLVLDSGQGRELVAGKFAETVRECRAALKVLAPARPGLSALCEATREEVEAMKDRLGPVLYRRVRHVVSENARVQAAAAALEKGDMELLGRLMEAGYESSKNDYENSTPALETLHDLVSAQAGVFGARICGAGWGGCLLALASKERVNPLAGLGMYRYVARMALPGRAGVVGPAAPAGPV
jgi:galactokinase